MSTIVAADWEPIDWDAPVRTALSEPFPRPGCAVLST
jgi:hypothetical protein